MRREGIHPTVFVELQAQIANIEHDQLLGEESNFVGRATAQRVLEQDVVGRIELLLNDADKGERKRLRALKREALRIQSRLEATNAGLLASFRAQIRARAYSKSALRQTLAGYVEPCDREE